MSSNDFYPPEDLPAVIAARERFMADPAHIVPPLRHRQEGRHDHRRRADRASDRVSRPARAAGDGQRRHRTQPRPERAAREVGAQVPGAGRSAAGRHPRKHDGWTHRDRQCRVAAHVRLRRRRGSQQGRRPDALCRARRSPGGDAEGLRSEATPPAPEAMFRRRDGTLFPVERYVRSVLQRRGRDRRRCAASSSTSRTASRSRPSFNQALKMEAIGQLTGGIAHDFNNILMIILANTDALQDDAEPRRSRTSKRVGADRHGAPTGPPISRAACWPSRASCRSSRSAPTSTPLVARHRQAAASDSGAAGRDRSQRLPTICGRSRSIPGSSRTRWSISASTRAMPCRCRRPAD